MKKIIMLAFMGMTAMSFSRGLNFKGGFDFDRTLTGKEISKSSQGKGFVLGLEGIAFDSKYVNLGLGAEYNGGLYLNKYDTKINNEDSTKAYTIPIYGLIQANAYKDKLANVYPFARLGYAVSKLDNEKDLSGVYYGLGLGVNIKNFIFEGLYDGIYGNKEKAFTHKIGVRLGYSLDFDKMGLFDKKMETSKPVKKEVVMKEDIKPISETIKLVAPEKVGVYDLSNLTQEEKIEVEKAIKKANPNAQIKNILVDNMGNALVIFNDGSRVIIDKSKTVRNKSYAESIVLLEPERVQVYDLSNLTQKEKMMVAKAILNPNSNAPIKQIMVDNMGNALVIFNDGSRIVMDKSKTVREKELEVVKGALPTNCTVDSKMCIIRGFEIDGKEPSLEEQKSLKEIAKVMNEYSKEHSIDVINIIGHTDSTGSEEYNQGLSVIRAKNVADLLRRYGLNGDIKFGVVKGEGELKPIDTNRTVNGRYNNRRVVIIFDKLDEK